MTRDELRQALAAKVKDAYYSARDNGGTMHTAADDAADALLPVVDAQVQAEREHLERHIKATAKDVEPANQYDYGYRDGLLDGAHIVIGGGS